jgi:hypothetical protein
VPIALFSDEGLMGAFSGLAHTNFPGPVEEHERLRDFSIGNVLLVKGIEGQVQHPRAS